MGLVSNFFGKVVGISVPTEKRITVDYTFTGPVYTIKRLLGSSSTLALLGGSSTNLTLNATTGVVSVSTGIANAVSQTALIRENWGPVAFEYPLIITGSGGATGPDSNVTLQAEDGQFLQTEDGQYLETEASSTTAPTAAVAATLDPAVGTGSGTLSANKLTLTNTNNQIQSFRSTVAKNTGKKVFEVKLNSGDMIFGLCTSAVANVTSDTRPGADNALGTHIDSGRYAFYNNGQNTDIALYPGYTPGFGQGAGDTFMVATDFDTGKYWIGKGGNWFGGNPSNGTDGLPASSVRLPAGDLYAWVATRNGVNPGDSSLTVNFAGPFVNTIPTGFSAFNS